MTLKIQTPPTLNEVWLITDLTEHIKKLINDFFEDRAYYNDLERMWFETIDKELYEKFEKLHEKPPCLNSDIWYYEEALGKPPGFEIFINSMVHSMEFEVKCPDWNDPRKKSNGRYWINPYSINYHKKTTYTKSELQAYYRNYETHQQNIRDQINALPITKELQASMKETLIHKGLWEHSIELKADIETFNEIIKGFDQEAFRNMTLDTIQQPREVNSIIPEFDEDFFLVHIP